MALLTQYARKPLVLPKKGIIVDSSLAFNAPLWHPHLNTNPFVSKDRYASSCAITGTLWFMTGRAFDGDDMIDLVNVLPRVNVLQGTIIIWAKRTFPDDTPVGKVIIDLRRSGVTTDLIGMYYSSVLDKWCFHYKAGGVDKLKELASSKAPQNIFTMFSQTWDVAGDKVKVFVNGVQDGSTLTGLGTWAGVLDIGALGREAQSASGFYVGTIATALIYSRTLSNSEIRSIYEATKWRYL